MLMMVTRMGRGGSFDLKTVDPLNFLDECVLVVGS